MNRLLRPAHIDDPRILIEIISELIDEIQKGAVVLDTAIGSSEFGCIDLIAADRDKRGMLFFVNSSGQEVDFLRPFKCLLWYQENREMLQKLYSDAIDLSIPPALFFISPCYSHALQKVLLNLKEGPVTLLKYACFQDGEELKIFLEKITSTAPSIPPATQIPPAPAIPIETAPQAENTDTLHQKPEAADLKKFRQELGIDLSHISDEELRELIE